MRQIKGNNRPSRLACCAQWVAYLVEFVAVALVGVTYHPALTGNLPMITRACEGGHFHFKDIPDLRGQTAVVTGANAGLGFYTAKWRTLHDAACEGRARRRGSVPPRSSRQSEHEKADSLAHDLANLEPT